jgi:hypothetical protein
LKAAGSFSAAVAQELTAMRQSLSMSTLQDVKQAEKKMEAARKALFAYLELPKQQEIDVKLRTHLAENLQRATDEYVELIGSLEPSTTTS